MLTGQAQADADRAQDQDRHQRRGNGLREAGEAIDDRQPAGDHGVGLPADVGELRQLRHEDEDGERVDEAGDHRARHELHDEIEPEQPGDDLDQAHQDRGREKILDPVVANERDHEHRNCSGGGRDHAGSTADQRDRHGDRDRGIEADARIDAGDDGEADRLGNERESDDDAGHDVAAGSSAISEPLAPIGEKIDCH